MYTYKICFSQISFRAGAKENYPEETTNQCTSPIMLPIIPSRAVPQKTTDGKDMKGDFAKQKEFLGGNAKATTTGVDNNGFLVIVIDYAVMVDW